VERLLFAVVPFAALRLRVAAAFFAAADRLALDCAIRFCLPQFGDRRPER
jgi:hypothetical protein